jgi:hypothetical protein
MFRPAGPGVLPLDAVQQESFQSRRIHPLRELTALYKMFGERAVAVSFRTRLRAEY